MDPTGNGNWEADSVLYSWVEMPVTYTGVIVHWCPWWGAGSRGCRAATARSVQCSPRLDTASSGPCCHGSGISGKTYFKTGLMLHMQCGLRGKHERNISHEDTKMREGGEKKRGALGQEQRFSCSPWRRPWRGMGKVWGGRSDTVELLWTDSNLPLPSSASLKEEEEGKELGVKEWYGTWEKGRLEGGGLLFKSVFSFVLVSYHSIYSTVKILNWFSTSQICFACDCNWRTIFLPSSQPMSLLILFSPCLAEQGAVKAAGWEFVC